jgi:two-component system invasion response regulator UvrY
MVRVLVADDHEPFLVAAGEVVAATHGFELVALARSGEEAIALAESAAADLVVLDVHMPGIDGVEAARRILVRRPAIVALLVSASELPEAAHAVATASGKEHFGPGLLRLVWERR